MGWDAYAIFEDQKLLDTFEEVAKDVIIDAGSVDAGLQKGYLDCSDCACFIEDVLGYDTYESYKISSEKVHELYERLQNVDFTILTHNWVSLSVAQFLKICAENDLEIKISY